MKTELTRIERTSRIVLAFLVGILIWGAAIDQERFTVSVMLPVNLDIPGEYVVLGSYSDSVMISFTGTGWEMLSFQLGSPVSEIKTDVQRTQEHAYPSVSVIDINTSEINTPGSISVSQVLPGQIQVSVDTLISRRLPISVYTSDFIPARFRFVTVEPEFITVTGPASIVLGIDSVSAETVNTSSGRTTASLAFGGDMVAYSVQSVEILISDPVVPVAELE